MIYSVLMQDIVILTIEIVEFQIKFIKLDHFSYIYDSMNSLDQSLEGTHCKNSKY
jgi:hypothetical protein